MTYQNKKTIKAAKPVFAMPDTPISRLGYLLQYKRPANTSMITWFIDQFIVPVCKPLGGYYDLAGNYLVRIGDSRVLWSSHTDTVHNAAGTQKIVVSGDRLKVSASEKADCLGADCTTGVWLMLEMIQANVAGLYVFHASEEIGGIGSSHIADQTPDVLAGIDYAIAFDRKGTHSIITHQSSGRCCSDVFADSLSLLLPIGFVADAGGTFTDTANYTHLIGECSNISVGYFDQHTGKETQSMSHALDLRDAMLAFDESKLITSRKAGEIDPDDYLGFTGAYYQQRYGSGASYSKYSCDNPAQDTYFDLYDYIRANPDHAADLLESLGYDVSYFTQAYQY